MIQFDKIDLVLKNPKYQSLVVTGHVNIDFDSCGSIASFVSLAENYYHKNCDIVVDADNLAMNLQFPLQERADKLIDGTKEISKGYDLLVVLDCGDKSRIPEGLHSLSQKTDVLVIDHHKSESDFGTYRFVDSNASAVGQIIYNLAKFVGYRGDLTFANGIMISIYGDTGSFCHNNTTAEIFEIASEMCKLGASPNTISRAMFYNSSVKKLKVSSIIYDSIKQYEDGKITMMSVDENAIKHLDISKSDIDGFAESTLKVMGTKIGVYVKIQDNFVKFSFRSIPGVNVREVAEKFGGGGHDLAAGCKIENKGFLQIWEEILFELKKRV